MTTALDILIRARDEASAVIQRVTGAGKQLGSSFQNMSQKMGAAGMTMTRTVTPAAAALAVVFASAGKAWDEAVRTLRTGNTEAQFESLLDSAKRVAGGVTQSFDAVAAALDEVSDRTGLTGAPLERLTKQFLELEHLTGEAASETIPNVTRLFGDWSVATEDQAKTMDYLLRASEATGISIGQLSAQMVQFGSPLRQLGFTFDETAAMFAKFEREGVNVSAALPGLRMALKNLSAPTADLSMVLENLGITAKEPKDALIQLFDVIKDMPSTADANSLAFKVFGTRAGPDLAAAIREGRFELGSLIEDVKTGTATIEEASGASTSFADKLAMLRNRVMGVIGPFGDVGAALFGILAALGPVLLALSFMAPTLGRVAGALRGLAGALGAATAAAYGAVTGFVAGTGALVALVAQEGLAAVATLDLATAMGTLGSAILGPLGLALGAGLAIGTVLNNVFDISDKLGNLIIDNSRNSAAAINEQSAAFVKVVQAYKDGAISAEELTSDIAELNKFYGSNISAAGIIKLVTDEATTAIGNAGAAAAQTGRKIHRFAGMGEDDFKAWSSQIKADAESAITTLGGVQLATRNTAREFLRGSNLMAKVAKQDAAAMKTLASRSQDWVPDGYKEWLMTQGPGAIADFEKLTHEQQQKAVQDWRTAAGGAEAYQRSIDKLSTSKIDSAQRAVENLNDDLDTLKNQSPIFIDVYYRQHGSSDGGGYTPHAAGGIVTRPTLALVGEAGPEAIVPLSRLRSGSSRIDVWIDRRRWVAESDVETRYRGW